MAIATTSITVVNNNGSGTWVNRPAGGQASAQNTAIFITNSGSRGRKTSNETKGFAYDMGSGGTDISGDVLALRWNVLNGANLLATRTAGGVALLVEDTSGNISYWDIDGNDTYTGGWKVSVVDMATTESRNSGTAATLTAARYIGMVWNIGSISGGDPNTFIDQILRFPQAGLTITGNTTSLIDDLVDTIDDDATNGPYGLIERRAEQVFSKARIILSPDASDMSDTDRNLIFENPVYDAGSTIDSTLQEIGLESSDSDLITLTRCGIISAGPDEAVTTDANREFDFTSATGLTLDTCTVVGFDGTVVHLGASPNDCDNTTFIGCNEITSTGATLNGAKVLASAAAADGSAVIWDVNADPDGDLDDILIAIGALAHHAIEFSTSTPTTMTVRGATYTGFNASDSQNDSTFYFTRTSGTVTLNVVSSTGNFSYKSAGATISIVEDPVTVKVTAQEADGTPVQSVRVLLRASDGTGPLPFELALTNLTQTGGTATATTGSAHGLVTNDYVQITGCTPQGYNKVAQVTVTSTTQFTYSVDSGLASPATVFGDITGCPLYGLTDVNGEISTSRAYGSDQPFEGVGRKSTSSPYWVTAPLTGTVDNANGLDIPAIMVPDE